MALSEEVQITQRQSGNQWYAHFTKDDKYITYSSSQDGTFRVYAYELATGNTVAVTQQSNINHWFPSSAGRTTPLYVAGRATRPSATLGQMNVQTASPAAGKGEHTTGHAQDSVQISGATEMPGIVAAIMACVALVWL